MHNYKKISFIFPGQGAQYPGMGHDFAKEFSAARLAFDEADDLLTRKLSTIVFQGSESELTETKNSQTGIFVTSVAIFRVIKELFGIEPFVCAGLSLGEYTALNAGEWIRFQHCLPLVQQRGQFMNEACEKTKGTMAVVLGLEAETVEEAIKDANLPHDLWVANFNCPGQVVISGTIKGVEIGTKRLQERGARRVAPLPVHGAFHSGLMKEAEERLAPFIQEAPFVKGVSQLAMNVPGGFVEGVELVKSNLIKQVTRSVRWEQGIRAMDQQGVDLFIEIGPGKALAGMNRKIGVKAPTISIEKVEDLKTLTSILK